MTKNVVRTFFCNLGLDPLTKNPGSAHVIYNNGKKLITKQVDIDIRLYVRNISISQLDQNVYKNSFQCASVNMILIQNWNASFVKNVLLEMSQIHVSK